MHADKSWNRPVQTGVGATPGTGSTGAQAEERGNAPASVHWSDAQERSNMLALRSIAWIATRLGRPVARLLLHPITLYFLLLAPAARRSSQRYLARALGRRPGWRDSYRHLHAFAAVALDRIWYAAQRLDLFDLQVHGSDLMDATLAEGRGAFMLGAHFGSFEALHAVGCSHPELRVAMVMYPENARMVHAVLRSLAPDFELGIIPIGQRGSALAVRDWLDSGGLAGLLGDRYLVQHDIGIAQQGVRLPFLGRETRFSDGPLRMAMLLKRPVIFMVGLYRGGRRYEVRFEQLADFRQPPADAAAREQLVHAALADYVRRLEALCRDAPYNWFNFYDYWQEDDAPSPRPPGATPARTPPR